MQKTIILGVSGGIAAYKSAELARLLVKSNINVQVVMTDAAKKFITPLTFQAITNNKVLTNEDFWTTNSNETMEHIHVSRNADLILIAPATANFIAKINQGICDDLLTNICAARNCNLVICPAMNNYMFMNPPNLRNIEQLKNDGVAFIGPEIGNQACGETGLGRLTEPQDILINLNRFLSNSKLKDLRILISAGATSENIDDARTITNHSSGKMGISIANEAFDQGAQVTLIKGKTEVLPHKGIKIVEANNHKEMEQSVLNEASRHDIFISVAAVSDYKADHVFPGKIKKDENVLNLKLVKTSDILKSTKKLFPNLFCVGFAAESNNLINYAKQKLVEKNLDMIIANELQKTMGEDTAEVIILDKKQEKILPKMEKKLLANSILAEIYDRFKTNEN
ncbi:MAG: bifunctional phosphopantothenoylcysteine decarboxylase/phosphopantothenate--cysteine ligase CoaBC [Methylophilaceae bacterium]|nr:bifunctional phosphopantothenoylcysteine decarboxylase/phosphopantothenate--cysteine ligase CoaBC [Methylophilaceae bacterium]